MELAGDRVTILFPIKGVSQIARVGPVAGDRPRAVLRDAHAHRAEVRAQLGRNAEAVEDLKRAAEFADGADRAVGRRSPVLDRTAAALGTLSTGL